MTLSCYITDDEQHAIDVLSRYIIKTPDLTLIGTETDPVLALAEISRDLAPDIVFLDIDMPELNGLDMAELISPSTSVVFTTSYLEYGVEAFEKDAADYLLKPITYERFLKCILKVGKNHPANTDSKISADIFVKSNTKGKLVRLAIADIWYIENIGNYIAIQLIHGEKIITYLTLNEILTRLLRANFFIRPCCPYL